MGSDARYLLFDEIAAGGMGSVFLGRLVGEGGFHRTVAIKKLHPPMAKDPDFVGMFLDEARLASRVRHPNVCGTLDVVSQRGEIMLVLDYVHGESLSRISRAARERGEAIPTAVAVGILVGVLEGLHAAHEAKTDDGKPLHLVHRDVSPQNVMVGPEGIPRVLDFGIAKAAHRTQVTRDGELKGKISYMAPEQVLGETVDRRADVYAAGVVLWEMLAGEPLIPRDSVAAVHSIVYTTHDPPSRKRSDVPPELDAVVMRALARAPTDRWATARDMADALEQAVHPASARRIGEWVNTMVSASFALSEARVAAIEARAASLPGPIDQPDSVRVSQLPTRPPSKAVPQTASDNGVSITAYGVQLSRRRRRTAIAVGIGVAAALVVLLLVVSRLVSPRQVAAVPLPSAAQAAFPAVPPAPPSALPTAAGGPSATGEAAAVGTPRPAPQPSASLALKPAAPVTARPPASVRPPAPRPGPCNPPFFIDQDGLKHFKPECL